MHQLPLITCYNTAERQGALFHWLLLFFSLFLFFCYLAIYVVCTFSSAFSFCFVFSILLCFDRNSMVVLHTVNNFCCSFESYQRRHSLLLLRLLCTLYKITAEYVSNIMFCLYNVPAACCLTRIKKIISNRLCLVFIFAQSARILLQWDAFQLLCTLSILHTHSLLNRRTHSIHQLVNMYKCLIQKRIKSSI